MAKRPAVKFVCTECGEDYSKWTGKCENCGAWSTLVEFKESSASKNPKSGQGSQLQFKSIKEISKNLPLYMMQ